MTSDIIAYLPRWLNAQRLTIDLAKEAVQKQASFCVLCRRTPVESDLSISIRMTGPEAPELSDPTSGNWAYNQPCKLMRWPYSQGYVLPPNLLQDRKRETAECYQ